MLRPGSLPGLRRPGIGCMVLLACTVCAHLPGGMWVVDLRESLTGSCGRSSNWWPPSRLCCAHFSVHASGSSPFSPVLALVCPLVSTWLGFPFGCGWKEAPSFPDPSWAGRLGTCGRLFFFFPLYFFFFDDEQRYNTHTHTHTCLRSCLGCPGHCMEDRECERVNEKGHSSSPFREKSGRSDTFEPVGLVGRQFLGRSVW